MRMLHWAACDSTQFEVGKTYPAGKQINRYWQRKQENEISSNKLNELKPLYEALDKIDPSKTAFEILKRKISSLDYNNFWLKEYVFEHIRSSNFANAPSRKTCLFCFDNSLEPNKYIAKMGISAISRTLIEIEISEEKSSFLRVRPSILNCNLQTIPEMEKRAIRYWEGIDTIDFDTEILLSGEFSVTRIFT